MADLGIDETLNVYIDSSGNLAFVEGKEAFEQRLLLEITERYYDVIGSTDPPEAIERLRIKARRIADEDPNIETMPSFNVEFTGESTKELEVTIVYDTGDITELTI